MSMCPGNQKWLTCPPHLTYEGKAAKSYGCSRCGERVTKAELAEGSSIPSADQVRIAELEERLEASSA